MTKNRGLDVFVENDLLSVRFLKKNYTKKEAIGILEIRAPIMHEKYKDGHIWNEDHNKKFWVWRQNKNEL